MKNGALNSKSILIISLIAVTTLFTSCGGGSGSGPGGGGGTPQVSISVNPPSANLAINASQTFAATVTNATNTSVSWSVQEAAAGGTVTSAGVYTAPNHSGTYHVIATADADSTKAKSIVVTVAAPAPVFTSTPPASNSQTEGTQMTYNVAATDPAGGSVTFGLTTSPNGAVLTGNQLTWTPGSTQGRVANAFTVTATTSEGGTATQTFSITPAGTIHGTRAFSFYTSDMTGAFQHTDLPDDTTAFSINALIPDGNGNFTTSAGTGSANGTYTIPNVPSGYYWLQHGTDNFFWTKTSNIDTGFDWNGRSNLAAGTSGTSLVLSLSNLTAWQATDTAYLFSPNSNNYFAFSGITGSTQINSAFNLAGRPLIDSAQGDYVMLYQMVDQGGYQVLKNVYGPQAFTTTSGAATALTASAVPVTATSNLRNYVKGSQFAGLTSLMSPSAVDYSTCLGLQALPGPANVGFVTYAGDLVLRTDCYMASPQLTDVDAGNISYGNPYPSTWPVFVEFKHRVRVPFTLPGTTTPANLFGMNFVYKTTLPTSTSPILPLVGPVRNPTIAAFGSATSNNLLGDVSGIGLTPVIQWQSPTIGVPTAYMIGITRLTAVGTVTVIGGTVNLWVGGTVNSVQVPPGVLSAGQSYVVRIAARSVSGVNGETSPYRLSLPFGESDVISGIITP